jgi:phosphatidate cytidylyltransferase
LLKQRIITAVIMAAFVASCVLFLSAEALSFVFVLLVLISAWEWSNLSGLQSVVTKMLFTVACGALMLFSIWHSQLFLASYTVDNARSIIGLGCLWWSIALLWVKSYPASSVLWTSLFMKVMMGFLTLVPAWLALVFLRVQDHGIALIFILIGLVASADIGAYFSGKAWGTKKLAPEVSPGKSWAGFFGGLVASCVFSLIIWFQWGQLQLSFVAAMSIAIVTSLASVLGDLLESMVKRERGIKDSGQILPGHGGMMDRLDSLTAAAPVFALSLMLAGGS